MILYLRILKPLSYDSEKTAASCQHSIQGICYHLSTEKLNWADAAQACKDKYGGCLAELDAAWKWHYVVTMVQGKGM